MSRKEEIEQELRTGGTLDQKLWELGYWLTCNRVPYCAKNSDETIKRWEKNGINESAVTKYKLWRKLSKYEKDLKEELAEIIKQENLIN